MAPCLRHIQSVRARCWIRKHCPRRVHASARREDSLVLGQPIWGTHKKMTEKDEQELREFVRLKHHSHELKNQYLG